MISRSRWYWWTGVMVLFAIVADVECWAQGTFSDPGTSTFTGFAQAYYAHRDPDPPSFCNNIIFCQEPPDGVDPAGNPAPPPPVTGWIQDFWGFSYGRRAEAACKRANTHPQGIGCPYFGGRAIAQTVVGGIGTSTVRVIAEANTAAKNNCECPFDEPLHPGVLSLGTIGAIATLDTTVDVQITTSPPGQQVLVFFSWYALVNRQTKHEAVEEDPACIVNVTFEVNGVPVIAPGAADVDDCDPLTQPKAANAILLLPAQPAQSTGVIAAQDGDIITISMSASPQVHIAPPPQVPHMNQDRAFASFFGDITLSIDNPLPPFQNPITVQQHEFSVAIGSDAEMSDPNFNGNEVFDPGDTYPWFGPALPPCGASGVRDDALAFNVDFWPQAPDCAPHPSMGGSGAETCMHSPADIPGLTATRFDLNGTTALDTELRFIIPPNQPVASPIARFPSDCIYANPPFLLISYKDSAAPHYAWSPCIQLPINSTSAGFVYGTDAERDEVIMLATTAIWPPVTSASQVDLVGTASLLSESDLHPSLAPSPLDPLIPSPANNDVNALNVNVHPGAQCQTWYITPSHEATGLHPAVPGLPLDPGNVYEVLPTGGLVKVVDHAIHLGLFDGVDLNAIEFIWLRRCDENNPTSCADFLALLFSVEEDDFLVPGDQSGGLNPRMIYASFLDGSHFEYIPDPLDDNVNALAASPFPFAPVPPAVAANDECPGAASISLGDTTLTHHGATPSPAEPNPSCPFGGPGSGDNDLWFEFTSPCTSPGPRDFNFMLTADPASPSIDRKLAIYPHCPPAPLIACASGPGSVVATAVLLPGQSVWIRVGVPNGGAADGTTLSIDYAMPCCWDLTGSCSVGVPALLQLLSMWGQPCPCGSPGPCGVSHLLDLLSNWGGCP